MDAEVEVVGTVTATDRVSSGAQSSSSRHRNGPSTHRQRRESSSDRDRDRERDRSSGGHQATAPRSHSRWDRRGTNSSNSRMYSRNINYTGTEFEDHNSSSSLDAAAALPPSSSSAALGSALQQMQQLEVIQQQHQQVQQQQQQQQPQQWGMMYPMIPLTGDPSMMTSMMMPAAMAFNQFSFLGATDAALVQMSGGCSDSTVLPMIPGGGGSGGGAPLKEIIHCKSCTLFPPNLRGPETATGEKPPGCRTVFVGGLPESANEEIVHEIFNRCGEISTVRMSKKNFCHIRFEEEICVENAIYLSGYRIRIGSNADAANTGRLHVDYAQARDDFYEWECRQRQLQREQRHRERVEREDTRPPSPPPVAHFSEHEASALADSLKAIPNSSGEDESINVESIANDNSFYKAVQTLATWLDRGDCIKRNSVQFYGMIQSTNSHIRRLASEKSQVEEEFHRAKEKLRQQVNGILIQFNLIEKVFMAASQQKVWDHFTKAQRRSIDMWKKQAQAIKDVHLQDALNDRVEDEMDFSDDDDDDDDDDGDGSGSNKKSKGDEDASREEELKVSSLQEENDSMRCQLEAYKNEVEILKMENRQESDEKDKQTRSLQQALQGMQQQLIQVNQHRMKDEEQLNELKRNMEDKQSVTGSNREEVPTSSVVTAPHSADISSNQLKVTENEAKMIGLLATFLNVHPFGASIDYIWSYLQRMNGALQPSDVETLLLKFPPVFKQELSGVGANLERKWRFNGFDT